MKIFNLGHIHYLMKRSCYIVLHLVMTDWPWFLLTSQLPDCSQSMFSNHVDDSRYVDLLYSFGKGAVSLRFLMVGAFPRSA